MVLRDFRDFLAEVERRGDMKLVEGADCDLEIGTLTELMCEQARADVPFRPDHWLSEGISNRNKTLLHPGTDRACAGSS